MTPIRPKKRADLIRRNVARQTSKYMKIPPTNRIYPSTRRSPRVTRAQPRIPGGGGGGGGAADGNGGRET